MKKITSFKKSIRIYGPVKTLNRYYFKFRLYILKKILKRQTAVRKIHGSRMILDLANPGISQVLYVAGTREDLDIEIVKKELNPGMNVLEAGANIGYYLLLEGKILGGDGRIYAFEPDPRNTELLKKNIRLNRLDSSVKFFPYAVADKNSTEKFYLTSASNLNTMISGHIEEEGYIEVKTVKIDDFSEIEEDINFIRMDIEGYEYEALIGMIETLKKCKTVKILLELHPQFYNQERNFAGLVEKLFEIGFRVKYITSAGHHSPPEITNKGYQLIEISREMKISHGFYQDIKNSDFIELVKNKNKIIRSALLVKE